MEPGEIIDSNDADRLAEQIMYDPELEWPGDDINPSSSQSPPYEASQQLEGISQWPVVQTPSTLRLLVTTSSTLPSARRVVVPPLSLSDPTHELQFGRDRAPGQIARVRLPELAVSKLHASIFWDEARSVWSIVDRGSKHGTFLCRENESWRLSRPKETGLPQALVHGDTLEIGSTTFLIHIHNDVPCIECTIGSPQEGVPVFNDASKSRKHAPAPSVDHLLTPREDPRKAIASLKRSLLKSNSSVTASATEVTYIDRAARRRAMGGSLMDAPGTSHASTSASIPSIKQEGVQGPVHPCKPSTPVTSSDSPEPLPTTNVGHQLLMKQGWRPGEVLGLPSNDHERSALLEPLNLNHGAHRAGIGSHVRESRILSR
jgi:hypothetical protein